MRFAGVYALYAFMAFIDILTLGIAEAIEMFIVVTIISLVLVPIINYWKGLDKERLKIKIRRCLNGRIFRLIAAACTTGALAILVVVCLDHFYAGPLGFPKRDAKRFCVLAYKAYVENDSLLLLETGNKFLNFYMTRSIDNRCLFYDAYFSNQVFNPNNDWGRKEIIKFHDMFDWAGIYSKIYAIKPESVE